jgi:putative transposase
LRDHFDFSERRACKVIGFQRSSCRYVSRPNDDAVVIDKMREVIREWPRFGCPRVHLVLRHKGIVRNHKRTERLYRLAKLQLKNRKRKRRVFKPENPLPPAKSLNARWSMDFVHDSLHNGRSFRILTMIDEFSRESLHMEIDFSLSGHRVVRVLNALKKSRGSYWVVGNRNQQFLKKFGGENPYD